MERVFAQCCCTPYNQTDCHVLYIIGKIMPYIMYGIILPII